MKKIYKTGFYFLIVLIVVFFIIRFVLFILNKAKKSENFTPRIRKIYRPYYRNARLNVEHFMNKWNKYFSVKINRFLS